MKVQFKIQVEGEGIVNGGDFKSPFNKSAIKKVSGKSEGKDDFKYDNIVVPQIMYNEKNNSIHPIITRTCFLGSALGNTLDIPEVDWNHSIAGSARLNPISLLRGWLGAKKSSNSVKKASPISMSDLRGEAWTPTSTVGSKANVTDESSFFHELKPPKMTYSASGFVDLDALVFLSTDDLFDRQAIFAETLKDAATKAAFRKQYGVDLPQPKLYKNVRAALGVMEEGILLPSEVIKVALSAFIDGVLDMRINKANAYARTSTLTFSVDGEDYDVTDAAKRVRMMEYISSNFKSRYQEADSDDLALCEQIRGMLKQKKKKAEEEKAKEKKAKEKKAKEKKAAKTNVIGG